MANKIKIGITQGDGAGVGWEVILGALADPRIMELATFVVYGSSADATRSAEARRKAAEGGAGAKPNGDAKQNGGADTDGAGGVQFVAVASARGTNPRAINFVDTGGAISEPGVPTPESGAAAVRALKAAAADLKEGAIDAVVTAPISKENARGEGFDFAGHTEFFAAEFGGTPLMMMCSGGLRVALVTAHMSLADVSGAISRDKIVSRLKTLAGSLTQDFSIVAPRIAVMALNPHAGEGGMMGTDEAEVIAPAIVDARAEGVLAFGPFAADGVFLSGEWRRYDALLAMYHDQGLAPFKAIAPDGVNFTAGLPVVRTSPDHGTAFDIAGKGVASPDSMRAAIYAAIDIHRSRAAWAEMSRNPLKHYEREKGDERTIDLSKTEL